MADKITYVVRKDGKAEFQGSLAELKAWLAEKRISSSDEVRRLGYVVLEGDDLWTRVGDRSELGFDLRQERDRLKRMQTGRLASILLFVSLSGALLVALLVTQIIPRYDTQVGVRNAEIKYSDEAKKLARDYELKLAEKDDAIAALNQHEAALMKANEDLVAELAQSEKAREDVSKQVQDHKAAAAYARLSNEVLKGKNDELTEQLEAYKACLTEERKELAQLRKKISTLESAPFVFEGVSYALKTRADVSRAEQLRNEWISSVLQVKSFEERVRVADDRARNYRTYSESANTYSDRSIYQGLYREANQDRINRQEELDLARTARDKQHDELVDYLKANSY